MDRVAPWAVASCIEGHDDEAVLREGLEPGDQRVVPVPRKHQCVFVAVCLYRVQETAQPPPVHLQHQEEALIFTSHSKQTNQS